MARFIGLLIVLLATIRAGLGLANEACPYDEVAADSTGRRCNRDAACTGESDKSDCKGNRRCRCDDICGFICIKIFQDYFCDVDDLPALTIGLTYVLSTDPVRFDTTATYSCGVGFELSDDTLAIRRCRGDERWSGETPTCLTGVACSTPAEVVRTTNTDMDRELYAIDERLKYTCDFGYYQLGNGYIYCQEDDSNPGTAKWTDIDEGFDCQPKSCGSPGNIRNGVRDGNIFTFGGQVYFSCNAGYKLSGRSYRVCQADGEWSGDTPTCSPVTCPSLTDPENGDIFGTDFSFGKRVKLTCDEGFVISGSNSKVEYATCQASGQWNIPIQCELVNCGDPGIPTNGNRNGDDFSFNGYLLFGCDADYLLSGEKSIYCKENNEWSADIPLCLAQCTLPAIPSFLEVSSGYSVGDWVEVGTTYRINCIDGYSLNSNTDVWECVGGSMSFDPVCTEKSCPWPDNIQNGQIKFSESAVSGWFEPYTVATYSCNEGYKLSSSGAETRRCRLGKFKSTAPTCTETICNIPYVANSVRDTASPILKHDQSVTFTCKDGYSSNDMLTLTCLNERFNAATPDCQEAPCPGLTLGLHLQVEYNTERLNGVYAVSTVATVSCDDSFYSPSETTVICRLGEFPQVSCLRLATCDVEVIDNAVETYTDESDQLYFKRDGKVLEGVKRSVQCNNPYISSGSPKSICLSTGKWDGTTPKCEKPKCQIPHPPKYGYYNSANVGYSILYPSTVTFGCRSPNSKIIGSSKLQCDRVVLQVGQCIEQTDFDHQHYCNSSKNPERGWFSYSDSLKLGSKMRLGCFGSNYMSTTAGFERTCIQNTNTGSYKWFPDFTEAPECILDTHFECRNEIVRRGSQTFQASSSSSSNSDTNSVANGRLYSNGAWIPRVENIGEWLEVDLGKLMNVYGIQMQGNYYDYLWVTLYHVAYRDDDSTEESIVQNEHGEDATFVGNVDRRTTSQQFFPEKVRARHVRIYPQEWYGQMSLRFGVVACEITAEELACEIPPVQNSVVYANNKRTASKANDYDTIIISCNTNYELANGKRTVTGICRDSEIVFEDDVKLFCEFTGINSTVPTNKVEVEEKCSMPQINVNTKVNVNYRYDLDDFTLSNTMFPSLTKLITRCRDIGKYKLNNGGERICIAGSWTRSPATCTLLENQLLFKKVSSYYQMVRQVAPNSTYVMIAKGNRKIKVICEVGDDSEIEFEPFSGDNDLDVKGDRIGGSTSVYYDISLPKHSGIYSCWDRDRPETTRQEVEVRIVDPFYCPMPTIANGKIKDVVYSAPYQMNTELLLSCNLDYRLVGERDLKCLYDGDWDFPVPHCVYTRCRKPPTEIQNGIIVGTGTAENTDVGIYCNVGFHVPGTSADRQSSVCIEGSWVPPLTSACVQPTVCEDLPQDIENGVVAKDTTNGVSITIYCNVDAVVEGTTDTMTIIHCIDGEWDSPFPSCIYTQPKCSTPPVSIWNGVVSRQDDIVTLTCDQGYYIPTTSLMELEVTCVDGVWDNNSEFPQSCTDSPDNEAVLESFSFPSLDDGGDGANESSSSSSSPPITFCSNCEQEGVNAYCKKVGKIFPVDGRITTMTPAMNVDDLEITINITQWLKTQDDVEAVESLTLTIEGALQGDCYCPAGKLNTDLRMYLRYNVGFKLVTKSYMSEDTSPLPVC